jgi:hypothetical protein
LQHEVTAVTMTGICEASATIRGISAKRCWEATTRISVTWLLVRKSSDENLRGFDFNQRTGSLRMRIMHLLRASRSRR